MDWLALTLLAIVTRSVYGVTSKTMSGRLQMSAASVAVTMLVLSTVVALLLMPFLGGPSSNGLAHHWPAIILMITASAAGNICYFEGIARLDSGIVQIAFSSIVIWGAALSAIFLDSHFTTVQCLGALLLMSAIWLAQFDVRKPTNRAVFIVLLSAALFAVFQVASARVATDLTPSTYMLLTYVGPALIIAATHPRRLAREAGQLRCSVTVTMAWPAALAAAMTAAYYVASFFAYRRAPDAGIVIILLSAQVVLGVLLSAVFLGERRHLGRKLGAGLVAIGAGILIQG